MKGRGIAVILILTDLNFLTIVSLGSIKIPFIVPAINILQYSELGYPSRETKKEKR